jgi:hypothetical protein
VAPLREFAAEAEVLVQPFLLRRFGHS